MPQHFQEEFLEFTFADTWHVIKFDEQPEYRRWAQEGGRQSLPSTKGVDFVGILGDTLYLIEAKDFRDHRIENRERLEAGTLAVELGQKVRTSVACIVGFARTSSNPENWAPFARLLADPAKCVKVVLWLEHELPAHPSGRRKALNSVRIANYKPRLKWLTPYVSVSNQDENVVQHLKVTNLPRQ